MHSFIQDAIPITKAPNKRVAASLAKRTSLTKKAEDLPPESYPLVKSPSPAKVIAKAAKTTPANLKVKLAKKTSLKSMIPYLILWYVDSFISFFVNFKLNFFLEETKQKQLEQRQPSPALTASEVKENEMLPLQKNSPATRRNQQAVEKTLSPKAKRALK